MGMTLFDSFVHKWRNPYFRLFVAVFVTICNFFIYAEDPIAHSKADAFIPIVGNASSFIFRLYPNPAMGNAFLRMFILKVFMVPLAIATGVVVGRQWIHKGFLQGVLKLRMFAEDKGTWFVMFFTTILSVALFSEVYNGIILNIDPDTDWIITSYIGLTNENFMRAAALGTWLGDSVTVMMVLDMMLQDHSQYDEWAPSLRKWWGTGWNRIWFFWILMIVLTALVVTAIATSNNRWDQYNGALFHTSEVTRATLAAFITLFDLLIVMQDWEFPSFQSPQEVNIVGLAVNEIKWDPPQFVSNLFQSDFWSVRIEGKWFNYGIIFIVMCLDMNMLKNQVLYVPQDFAQFPDAAQDNRIWTIGSEVRANDPQTILDVANLDIAGGDFLINARFNDAGYTTLAIAAVPALLGGVLFFALYYIFNRAQKSPHWKSTHHSKSASVADNSPQPSVYKEQVAIQPTLGDTQQYETDDEDLEAAEHKHDGDDYNSARFPGTIEGLHELRRHS